MDGEICASAWAVIRPPVAYGRGKRRFMSFRCAVLHPFSRCASRRERLASRHPMSTPLADVRRLTQLFQQSDCAVLAPTAPQIARRAPTMFCRGKL